MICWVVDESGDKQAENQKAKTKQKELKTQKKKRQISIHLGGELVQTQHGVFLSMHFPTSHVISSSFPCVPCFMLHGFMFLFSCVAKTARYISYLSCHVLLFILGLGFG